MPSPARSGAARRSALAVAAGVALLLPSGAAWSAVPTPLPPVPVAALLPTPAVPESVPGEVLVGYVPGSSRAAHARARGRADARLVEHVVPRAGNRPAVDLLRLHNGANRAQASSRLLADPAVAYVEPNWIYTDQATSSDPYYTDGSLWGLYGSAARPANPYGSNAAAAWAAGRTGSATVYVGVIDEGIQVGHPDLSGRVRNPGETANGVDDDGNGYVDDVNGWDFAGDDRRVYDGGRLGDADDHGTHVAGTIGAKANGAGVVGVSWKVRMISAKFMGSEGGTTSDAVAAIDYLIDLKVNRGPNIVAINSSWGGPGYSEALKDAIERANQAGILFVAAAGNGGSDGVGDDNDIAPSYPASYTNSNVISVAAITSTGNLAPFSNYGATGVDVGAPGAGILSTTAYNGYSFYSGTSMAAPHVTGAVALYASVKPRSSAAAIKNALLTTAVPTTSLAGMTSTGGRLDINAALVK